MADDVAADDAEAYDVGADGLEADDVEADELPAGKAVSGFSFSRLPSSAGMLETRGCFSAPRRFLDAFASAFMITSARAQCAFRGEIDTPGEFSQVCRSDMDASGRRP